jgi:hypothetical protein
MGSAGLLSSVCAGCATESQKNSERAWMDLNGSVAFLQTFWCKNGRLPTNDQYNSHIRKDPNILEGVLSDWRFSCLRGTGKDRDGFYAVCEGNSITRQQFGFTMPDCRTELGEKH